MGPRLVDLGELPEQTEPEFGGKAAGLARLVRSGAAVPPGFALEATAGAPDGWAAGLRCAFLERLQALLEHGPVAVRSSAVGEDSRERSFAGLLATTLHVTTEEAALEAVSACVASGDSERVRSYGRGAGLPVGVVVQRQVEARSAGVCFTKDPTGRDGAVVVEAVAGLGEALVSGYAEPERWRAYRNGWGAWECLCDTRATVLDAALVSRLAGEARRIESRLGAGLDLEWALDADGRFWWLQCRPVTAASEAPVWVVQRACEAVDDGPVSVWSNWNVRETMPEPLSPLTWSIWREEILPAVVAHLFGPAPGSELQRHLTGIDLVHGRVYFNLNSMLATPVLGSLAVDVIRTMDARVGGVIEDLVGRGVLRPRRLPGRAAIRTARLAAAALRGLWRLTAALRPRRALSMLERDAAAVSARGPVARLDDTALAQELSLWSQPETRRLLFGLQMEAVAALVYAVARRAFRRHPMAAGFLATGIPANPTTRISLAIDALAASARELRPEFAEARTTEDLLRALDAFAAGRAWRQRLEAFLAEFGHRGPQEFDLGARRWREEPTMILELVRARLGDQGRPSVAERMSALYERRRAAIDAAVAASGVWRRPLLRILARLVELYMPLREAPKHYGLFVFDRTRAAVLELGQRLEARSAIGAAADVFLLDAAEIRSLVGGCAPAGLRAEIESRRRRQDRFRRERPPELLRSDGVPVLEPPAPCADGALRGTPVSVGVGRGPVRVLTEPDPRRLETGDVLVVEFADPAWTPLFPRAAAVVMEVGGLMCHAAVVAREMGIPAVFAVAGATRLLVDGEDVTVDGTAGTITRARVEF